MYLSKSSLQDFQEEIGQIGDLQESLLDLIRVYAAPNLTVPNRLFLTVHLYQIQLLQLHRRPLQHVLRVDEGAPRPLAGHQVLLEVQVNFVDCFETKRRALVLVDVVDHRHDQVFGKGAG